MHNQRYLIKFLFSFFILLNFSSFVFAQELKSRVEEFPEKEMKSQNKTIVKMFAEEISKTLPQKIDKYTTLMYVKSKNTTIIYTFEINTGSKSDETVINEDRRRMKKAIQNGVCKFSQKFLEAGINISYSYVSAMTKKHLFRFDITQKDCNYSLK